MTAQRLAQEIKRRNLGTNGAIGCLMGLWYNQNWEEPDPDEFIRECRKVGLFRPPTRRVLDLTKGVKS